MRWLACPGASGQANLRAFLFRSQQGDLLEIKPPFDDKGDWTLAHDPRSGKEGYIPRSYPPADSRTPRGPLAPLALSRQRTSQAHARAPRARDREGLRGMSRRATSAADRGRYAEVVDA